MSIVNLKNGKIVLVLILLAVMTAWGIKHFKGTGAGEGIMSQESALYHCPMHPTYISEQPGDCPICTMRLVEVDKGEDTQVSEGSHGYQKGSHTTNENPSSACILHNCPMLIEGKVCPMLIFTEEGKSAECPVCETHIADTEKEVVKQPGDITGYTAVTLSTEKLQTIGVRVSGVTRRPVTKTIRTVGQIAHDPELYQAEQEYLQAARALRAARKGALPDVERQAQTLVDSSRIKLELMGFTQELISELEEADHPDESLLLARSGGKVWMYAPIYESDLDIVKIDQKVEVTAPNVSSGQVFQGLVRAIDPVLDPTTRSVRVRVQLDNPQALLKPNVYVTANIRVDLGSQLLIPEDAVLDSGERRIAFVQRVKGVFEPRLLVLGPKLEDHYVVFSGVTEGEEVVDQATFFIDSESKLKAAMKQGNEGSHTGHAH